MWTRIAHTILKNRLILIITLGLITAFMGYQATKITMTFKFAELVPKTHREMQYFGQFKEKFGEDANVLAIGIKDSALFEVQNFKAYADLCRELNALEGIDTSGAIGLPNMPYLRGKGKGSRRKFVVDRIFTQDFFSDSAMAAPGFQAAYEEKLTLIKKLQVYENKILNHENGATILLVPIEANVVNSKKRVALVQEIHSIAGEFSTSTGIQLRFAGIPHFRSVLTGEVQREMKMFLWLSIGITALILLVFFRSVLAMIFPLVVIGFAVVWTMGTVVLCGFEVNMVTGLIPPIIVVIGIPNCIYLLNKYHQEVDKHNNKVKALSTVIRKIGIVTLITNCTTAIGFLVLISADITILREFGIVAGINVLATFIISIILIPAFYSFLPTPNTRQLKHLDSRVLWKYLRWLERIVLNHRTKVYVVTVIIIGVALWGSWKVYSVSYMVDDIPESSQIKQDLRWFEKNFEGTMPLEVVINTKDSSGYQDLDMLRKIDAFESYLVEQPEIGSSLSIVQLVKAARQSLYYNDTSFYGLPTDNDKAMFGRFLRNSTKRNEDFNVFDARMIDSVGNIRLSLKVADIGSKRMDTMVYKRIAPVADSIFETEKPYLAYKDYSEAPYRITGTTLLFIKGNQFLLWSLRQSLIIAIILISFIMALLFRSVKMIIISLIPNLIPLAITGAVMGYFGIPLKPSTALIFSIAFGISVDDSIHFLAKYRQELFANQFSVPKAVSISIRETGSSMIYTSIVLFAGFIIFAFSNFLGTVMLGILTSCTLMMAMFTNLIVLPSLLLTFDSGKRRVGLKRLIDSYNENGKDESGETADKNSNEQVTSNSEI